MTHPMLTEEMVEAVKQKIRDEAGDVWEWTLPKGEGDKYRSGEWDMRLSAQFWAAEIALRTALPLIGEACAKVAEKVGNFGDYKHLELTADYGQPRFDMMNQIAAAIRSATQENAAGRSAIEQEKRG